MAHCTSLKKLRILRTWRPEVEQRYSFMDPGGSLESLDLGFLPDYDELCELCTNADIQCKILEYVENDGNLKDLKLGAANMDMHTVHEKLQSGLLSNKSLESLSLYNSQGIFSVLTDYFANNICSLKHLGLRAINRRGIDDSVHPQEMEVSMLLHSLKESTVLRSLFLDLYTLQHMNKIADLLLKILPDLSLESLKVTFFALHDADDFAIALAKNHSLTYRMSPYIRHDFVCRLYTRRKRFEQAVKGNELDDATCPWLLESCGDQRVGPFIWLSVTFRFLPYHPFGETQGGG
eukprot:scaffold336_cov196-Amphora_coffeaeformis.AAC.18